MFSSFFASPYDQTAYALCKANWRDIDPAHYMRQLAQRDRKDETMAIRCLQLQSEMNTREDNGPDARLLEECVRQNKVLMSGERDLEKEAGWSLHLVLSTYLYNNAVAGSSILELLAKHDAQGANLLHVMLARYSTGDWSSWLRLIEMVMERDQEHRAENLKMVYAMLNQRISYYPSLTQKDRPVDILPLNDAETVQSYVDFVLILAGFGLPRDLVVHLLETRGVSLLSRCWKQVPSLPAICLLDLIASGFVQDKELSQFVNRKKDLLSTVLEVKDKPVKQAYLEQILNANSSLGKLFMMKAGHEWKALSLKHGYLKKAHAALRAMTQSVASSSTVAEEGFVLVDVTDVPETLFAAKSTSADAPLVGIDLSPDGGLRQ